MFHGFSPFSDSQGEGSSFQNPSRGKNGGAETRHDSLLREYLEPGGEGEGVPPAAADGIAAWR